MRREITALLLAAAATRCASSSIRSDLERVRELADVSVLPPVAADEIRDEAEPEVRSLLRRPLDADAAVRVALLNNRALRAELRELGIARGELVQAGLLPNPVVEVEVLPERDTSVELRVEYPLTEALFAPVRDRAARADLEASRVRAAAAIARAGYDVRTAFVAVQLAEHRLAISRRSLDALAASRDAAAALLEAGNIKRLEGARRIAEYERARVAVAELELELADRRERVHRLLGLHGQDTTWRTSGSLRPPPDALVLPDELESRALEANLGLARSRAELDAIAGRTGITRMGGWLPHVEVDVHALYGRPEERMGSDEPLWRFGAGVSVRLPLFDRGQGALLAQEAELYSEAERLVATAVAVRSTARTVRNHLVSAHARAQRLESVLIPAQKQVTAEAMLEYNAMQIGVFDLVEARREELDLELEHAEALAEYWTASAALQALLAGALPDGGTERGDD